MTDAQPPGVPRFTRRRAALTVAAGLLPAGALVGGAVGMARPADQRRPGADPQR